MNLLNTVIKILKIVHCSEHKRGKIKKNAENPAF